MATIAEIKQQYPDLADSTDDQVVDALHQAFYSDLPREQIAQRLGVKSEPAPAEKSGAMRRVLGDSAVSLARGVIGVPEALTGIADLATGGRAGKALQDVGVDYKRSKEILGDYYSPEQKAANEEVQKAEGFLPTVGAMVRNPSTIVQQAIESAPSMLPGAGVARGALAVAPRIGAIAAGALGEGATAAGQNAEQVRQEDPNGTLTGTQSAILAASGLATGAIGFGAGKVANKLGIGDLHTMLAAGKLGAVGDEAIATGSTKGLVRKAIEGGLTEGVLQELPQSAQEQVAQNVAQGKPWGEGVAAAGAQGMLAGGLMGAVGGPLEGHHEPVKSAGDVIREDLQPQVGPLTAAVNAGIEDAAQKADAAQPVVDVPHPPRAANAAAIAAIRALPPEQQQDALHLQALGDRMDVAPGVRRYAQNRLDKMLGDLQPLNPEKIDTKTGEPVPEPVPTVAAPKVGNETDQSLARQESTLRANDAAAAAQREADRPPIPKGEQQDGDILNRADKPFTTMPGAMSALTRAGDGHELVRVTGGLVVRKTKTERNDGLEQPAGPGPDQGSAPAVAAAPGGNGPVVSAEPQGEPSRGPVAEPVAGAAAPDAGAGGTEQQPAVAQPPHIGGEHIADGFHAFTPESGTLGVPRADMPQVRADHRGALTQFLAARGITHEQVEVPADSLKPTQAEFSPEKVLKAMSFEGQDRSILTSSDGYVLDGHHQWMNKREQGLPIKTIRLNAPIKDLLPVVREFPSATTADGATEAKTNEPNASRGTDAPAQAETAPPVADSARGAGSADAAAQPAGPAATRPAKVATAGVAPKVYKSKAAAQIVQKKSGNGLKLQAVKGGFILRQKSDKELAAEDKSGQRLKKWASTNVDKDSLLTAIAKAGGLAMREKADTITEGNKNAGGRNVFTEKGSPIDLMATTLHEDGFIPPHEYESDGGVTWLRDAIAAEFAGLKTHHSQNGDEWMRERYEASRPLESFDAEALAESGYTALAPSEQQAAEALLADAEDAANAEAREQASDMAADWSENAIHEVADEVSQAVGAHEEAPGRPAAGSESRDTQGRGEPAAPQARPEGAAKDLTLTAPTKAQVIAQQDALEKERADKEAPADKPKSKLTGEQVDIFNPQSSVFDVPVEPAAAPAPAVSKNTIFTEDAAAAARAILKKKLGGTLNSGIDPELLQAGITLAGYHIEKGARTFAAFAQAMVADLGENIRPYLKSFYMAVKFDPRAAAFDGMSTSAEVESADSGPEQTAAVADTPTKDTKNVPSADSHLERNREDSADPARAVEDAVPAGPGEATRRARDAGNDAGREGARRTDDSRVPDGVPSIVGERGDQLLLGGEQVSKPALVPAGSDVDQRGGGFGDTGVPVDRRSAIDAAPAADRGLPESAKRTAQLAAEKIPVKPGIENIRATLPYLLEGQQEDVHTAETRYAKPEGYGMLFTNGTGTGKTFTGLGIAKRFQRQGKTNMLFVAPSDKIIEDWINSAAELGLTINRLEDTNQAGNGPTITTYANFGANRTLADREWDLVVHDEAHYLTQDKDGTPTSFLQTLRAITHHPEGYTTRAAMLHRDLQDRIDSLTQRLDAIGDDKSLTVGQAAQAQKPLEAERMPLLREMEAKRDAVKADVKAKQGAARARVAFLSATPFAYEKTINWAEGYLFDYAEGHTGQDLASGSGMGHGYNSGNWREQFFMQHLGYRMRYNKLTEPDAKVDRGLLQRQFNGWLKKRGVLSGRMLDVKADYDRRFQSVESEIGTRIDEALDWLRNEDNRKDKGMQLVERAINGKFDYLSRRYLLEAIKASEVLPHVREHMAMGRKVVVFHDYKKGGGFNPFDMRNSEWSSDEGEEVAKLAQGAYAKFADEFKDLVDTPFHTMPSPIATFQKHFPDVLLFNGDVSPKQRRLNVAAFNDDKSGPRVLLVQSAAGKEGISLHDITGVHQRALFNLGQPTQPTTAIQQEGRTYRTGQVTNTMFRYLNTGTNWERWAFATTIATRASAAENLGMGELARSLKDAFISAFEESGDYRAGMEGEGTGGKERDRAANNALTEFDRARAFYYGTGKKTAKTKAQEGTDYYATPEPVGLKMVQWSGVRGGEDALEPSAGHGAIARWFPETVNRTAIEPSLKLAPRLAMVFDGKIITDEFEDHNVVNKYDAIAMNPPFGSGGRMAIDHLAKAATHLRDGGRIVALIPTGPAADAKFKKWFYEEQSRPARPVGTLTITVDGKGVATQFFKGDTIQPVASWAPAGVVVGFEDGKVKVKASAPEFRGAVSLLPSNNIKSVQPTGARTETYRPAADLHLVANITMPSSTFERAGTSVMTRIVVIDKLAKDQTAPNQVNRDLSDVGDTEALFKAIEDMNVPARTKPVEDEPTAPPARVLREVTPEVKAPRKLVEAAAPAPVVANGETVEHVTAKGKTLRGIVRTDLTYDQAKAIDPYTFRKNGGMFIREKYLTDDDAPAASRSPEQGPDAPAARRGTDAETAAAFEPTQRAREVEQLATLLTSRWTNPPKVEVVNSIDDPRLPESMRREDADQLSQDAKGSARGFYSDAGTVYLVADQLHGDMGVLNVLMHESLGHYGLRGHFGQELGTILDRMAILNAAKVRDAARRYGKNFEIKSQRRQAAEEVLAEMAEKTPELGWVKRAIAAIRAWFRQHVPGYHQMKLSDNDIIANYIIPARNFVKQGRVASPVGSTQTLGMRPAASRSLGVALGDAMGNVKNVNLPAGYKVADLMDSAGKLSLWHKTVGSQYNLAQRSPEFKRVFDGGQTFLNDASYYTNEAANLAPKVLPKLEGWKDIAKSPLSAADTKAIAAPIFEGTLSWARDANGKPVQVDDLKAAADAMDAEQKARALFKGGHLSEQVLKMWQGLPVDQFETIINGKYERDMLKAGVVWTPAELKAQFNATGELQADGKWSGQIGLYNEFRAATDESLSNLATSEMINYAGKDADAVREKAMALGHDQAAVLLRDHLFKLAEDNPARAEALNEAGNKMIEIADHATDMQKRGYAPLSRFGTYTLDATLATGERYFSLFETPRERARMQRQLEAAGATSVTAGTMSQEDYKLLNGISPETASLFGEMLGLDRQGSDAKDAAFAEFIKRGVSNRSALKRLLKRQGIAGFSEDAGRVLAGFVYSNGRKTSSNLHMGEVTSAVDAMSKQGGELKDAAVRLADYLKNPQEEAQALRGLLFAQYLGGSVASAMVNATQPFTVTFPYLSQFGGIGKAGKQMLAAVKVAGKKTTGDTALDKALHLAEEQGTLSPQEVHQLMAQAQGKSALKSGDGTALGNATAKASNVMAKVGLAWGKVFSVAEQFNRRITFIAAYRTAIDQGIADPAAFAAKAVNETQFISNKGNKPQWARGAIGGTLFTFKSYGVQYMELLQRMATAGEPGSPERAAGRKAALLAVAVLFLMGGADGLPFEANVEDLIDAFMQHLGYNFSSKREKQAFFANLLGEDMARFVNKGLSGLPGAPIDVSGRMGMGRLIPGTGLFAKKADHTSDVAELFGPVGDLAKRAGTAVGQLLDGDVVGAGATMSPVASRNIQKAVDMLKTDSYRDAKGRKVIDTTVPEAILKAIGFQPNSVARVQEATSEIQQAVALTKLRTSELTADMAQAVYEKDEAKKADVRAALQRWNENNPESRISISMPSVIQRVKAMREDKATRIEKTAPRAMRAEVRRELQGAGS